MRRRPFPLAVAAGAALLATAGQAHAGDAACLWNNLSPASRDAFIADYATAGPNATGALTNDVEGLLRAIEACGVDEEKHGVAAGEALAGHALKTASLRRLSSAHSIDEQKLVAAWEGLPADRRAAFSKTMLETYASGGDPDEASITTFIQVLDRAGATSPDAQTQVMVWLISTIMLAEREKQF